MRRASNAWRGKRADRLALLLGKIVALLLLFVLPAHATMQQIACEHLPTSYEQTVDGVNAVKVFRASADDFACSNDDMPALDVMAGDRFGNGWRLETRFDGFADRSLAATLVFSRFQRAPPAA